MLDMGFEPDVRKIESRGKMPSSMEEECEKYSNNPTAQQRRQTLLFSATFPAAIQKLGQDFLHDYVFVTIGTVGLANTDIEQTVLKVQQHDKREKLVEILNSFLETKVMVRGYILTDGPFGFEGMTIIQSITRLLVHPDVHLDGVNHTSF